MDPRRELLLIRQAVVVGSPDLWPEAIKRINKLSIDSSRRAREVRLVRAVGCLRQRMGADAASAAMGFVNRGGSWNELEEVLLATPEARSDEFVEIIAELQEIVAPGTGQAKRGSLAKLSSSLVFRRKQTAPTKYVGIGLLIGTIVVLAVVVSGLFLFELDEFNLSFFTGKSDSAVIDAEEEPSGNDEVIALDSTRSGRGQHRGAFQPSVITTSTDENPSVPDGNEDEPLLVLESGEGAPRVEEPVAPLVEDVRDLLDFLSEQNIGTIDRREFWNDVFLNLEHVASSWEQLKSVGDGTTPSLEEMASREWWGSSPDSRIAEARAFEEAIFALFQDLTSSFSGIYSDLQKLRSRKPTEWNVLALCALNDPETNDSAASRQFDLVVEGPLDSEASEEIKLVLVEVLVTLEDFISDHEVQSSEELLKGIREFSSSSLRERTNWIVLNGYTKRRLNANGTKVIDPGGRPIYKQRDLQDVFKVLSPKEERAMSLGSSGMPELAILDIRDASQAVECVEGLILQLDSSNEDS